MLRPLGQGHVPLIGSARQSPDFIEKRGSFCPSTSSSVSLKVEQPSCKPVICDTHTVLQQEQAVRLDGALVLCYLPSAKPCKDCLKQHPGRQDNITDSSAAGLEINTLFTPLRAESLWRI